MPAQQLLSYGERGHISPSIAPSLVRSRASRAATGGQVTGKRCGKRGLYGGGTPPFGSSLTLHVVDDNKFEIKSHAVGGDWNEGREVGASRCELRCGRA